MQDKEKADNQEPVQAGEDMEVDDQQAQLEIRQLQKRIDTLKAASTKRRKIEQPGATASKTPEQILAEAAAASAAAQDLVQDLFAQQTG
jgi:hypothetical protein